MNITEIKNKLNKHGWCIVPNILNEHEVNDAKKMFYDWQKTIKNL